MLILLAGCGFPAIDGEVVTRGRHVTLHADPALPICASTLDQADAFVDLAVAYLDAAPAPDVDYYLHDGHPSGCRLVGDDPLACTQYETIHTASWIHFHELVHTIARDWGRPPAFLLEGLAEGLGTTYPQILPQDRRTAELPLESTAFFAGDAGHNYQIAGDFVMYLLHRFGVAAFRGLARELPYLADELTTRATFHDITGVELASVVADWRTASSEDRHDLPLDRLACAAAVLPPLAPDAWAEDEPAQCRSGSSAAGSVLRQPVDHVVDLARDGVFALTIRGADYSAYAQVADCTTVDASFAISSAPGVQIFALGLLGAGPHAIEAASLHANVEPDPGPVSWSFTGLGPQSATCDPAPAFAAPAGPWTVTFTSDRARWPDGAAGRESWLRLDLGPDDVELVPTVSGAEGSELCSGACDALACQPVPASYTPVAGQPVYLHLRATGSSGWVEVTVHSAHSTTASRGPATTARSLAPR